MTDPRQEVPQAIQSLPSIGAIFLWLFGKDVQWWAAVLGLVFIALQIGYVGWKWFRDARQERERQEDRARSRWAEESQAEAS